MGNNVTVPADQLGDVRVLVIGGGYGGIAAAVR